MHLSHTDAAQPPSLTTTPQLSHIAAADYKCRVPDSIRPVNDPKWPAANPNRPNTDPSHPVTESVRSVTGEKGTATDPSLPVHRYQNQREQDIRKRQAILIVDECPYCCKLALDIPPNSSCAKRPITEFLYALPAGLSNRFATVSHKQCLCPSYSIADSQWTTSVHHLA